MRHEADGIEYDNGYLPNQVQEFEDLYFIWCNSVIVKFNLGPIWPGMKYAAA
jgi:hypothetical protein